MTRQTNVAAAGAYALGGLVALVIACDLLWMPIQVADALGEILDASRSPSVWASFTDKFGTEAYLRPMRIAQVKALFDLAHGHYWLAYRGFHAALLVAGVLLFVRALRVATANDFAAAAFALAVLVGLHTFRGTVQEAFPINHFLEIAVLCLLTLNLARLRGGPWADVAAAATFVVAVLTLESGLLVWVVAVACWLVGWRGISSRGVAVMTVLLCGYFYLRFVHLGTGVPTLAERSAGFGLEMLDVPELERRFGANPLPFQAYNVTTSFMSVLFSEPQSGVFVAVRDWLAGAGALPRVVVPLATSVVTTALIAWTAIRRLKAQEPRDDTARLLAVFAAVLAANAAISFAYTKDDIMSTAGVFYALAAFAAARELLAHAAHVRPRAAVAFALLLGVLSLGWSVRAVGVHRVLRSQAAKHQIDWVVLPSALRRTGTWPADGGQQQLITRLRADAVALRVPNTRAAEPVWMGRLWRE
jgi:hypothetical protein